MVPHPRHRGIQQSANMLHNRSTSLKIEKIITNIFTIMCTTCRHWQCGCRWKYPQPRMGHLQRFRYNWFVLWTYWHCSIAWFLWQRLGMQSQHGWHRGNFGFALMVFLMDFWALLGAVAEFDNATARRTPACMLLLRGGQGDGGGGRDGRVILARLIVQLGSWCWPQFFDVWCLMPYFSTQKLWWGQNINMLLD